MPTESLSKRYILTFTFNILNSLISFLTSILIIRALTPSEYGEYQFLFAIFITIFTIMNLNTQNGYFTFVSQNKMAPKFYRDYLVWEFIQLFIVILFTLIVYLYELFDLFLGINNTVLFIALLATFFSRNIRELITNTFESKRITSFYLIGTFAINIIHLILISIMILLDLLNIEIIFTFIILEFLIYFFVALHKFYKHKNQFINENKSYLLSLNINKFYHYSKPLFLSSLIASLYVFLERWLLQKYGGSEQQAYLALSVQFSTMILIFTTSVIKILWKEVAENLSRHNTNELENIFTKSLNNIYKITTLFALFIVFNTNDIITILYGEKYLQAAEVLALISFSTIHQTLGQIYGTFMLASERTKNYSRISILFSLLGIVSMYLAVAPSSYGFHAGALGIATAIVCVQFLSVSTMGYIINREFHFKSMFPSQLIYLIASTILFYSFSWLLSSYNLNIYGKIGANIIFFMIVLSLSYAKNMNEIFHSIKTNKNK